MTELTILNLLSTRPMYGVEMIEEIKRLSGNTVIMSLPTLYSSLHRMSNKRFVNSYQQESAVGGRRRVYNITKTGREYLEKNPIKIDYSEIAKATTEIRQPMSTLEEAFSLPLNNGNNNHTTFTTEHPNETLKTNLVELQIPQVPLQIIEPTPKVVQKNTTESEDIQSTYKSIPGILPYIEPTEKITTSPEPQYQQTSFGLSGTLGGNNLRPLVKLNDVKVGNDYLMINHLKIIASGITTVFSCLLNFFCSINPIFKNEFSSLIYIILMIYGAINLSVYLFYPRIKSVFKRKQIGVRAFAITLLLSVLIITAAIITSSINLVWLIIFALIPCIEFIVMLLLCNRSWFAC